MSFINSFSINTNKQQPFPFNISAVRFAKDIELDKLSIFIGDNGSGKSTLLETIAYEINLPLIGGYIKEIKDFALVVGNPSKQIGWVSEYGHRLSFDEHGMAICKESQQEYQLTNNNVKRIK